LRYVLPPRAFSIFRSLRIRLQLTRVSCLRLPAPPEGRAARNRLTQRRFPPAFTGGPTTEQPHTVWRLTPPFSLLRLACRRPLRDHCYQLPLWPEPFPIPASFPSPATKITVTCSARTEPATLRSACAECTVRPDTSQLVSARYHAVVSAPHCCCLMPQTDSHWTRPLYLVFSPGSKLTPRSRRRYFGRLATLLLCDLIRLSLALTGLRFRLQQPEISHRFRG